MISKVYFIGVSNSDDMRVNSSKLTRLLDESRLLDFIKERDLVAIKMHFGEEGNTGFVRPEFVRKIVDNIAKKKANSFLTDTNTLYQGRRMDAKEHLGLAHDHGFTQEVVGTKVLIPDDAKKENTAQIHINQKFIKVAKVAKIFLEADAIVGVAHFKGHLMTGFGGALKNIGMGCAVREGKLAQHSDVSPLVISRKCVGCKSCKAVCPADAISFKNGKSFIDGSRCIGCASCIAACSYFAIEVNWEAGGSNIQQKMVEYVKAVLKDKKDKSAFINFAIKITKECDCLAKDDPRIAPDIGIFISSDPVSIDKACLDLVNRTCGRDIFKEVHPERDGLKQLLYASSLGLGRLDYELIGLS